MKKPVLKIENLGVGNVTEVFTAMLLVASRFRNLVRGFNYGKLITFLGGLLEFAPLISAADVAWAEFKDMDAKEYAEVVAQVKKDFDIPDDRFEAAIEEALGITKLSYTWFSTGAGIWEKAKAYYEEYLAEQEAE